MGQGHRPRRRGVLPVVHLLRHRRSGRRWSARRRCSSTSTPRPSTSTPTGIAAAVATAKRLGLTPKAVIPVDLFGLPADHAAIAAVAQGRQACSCSTMPRRLSAPTYRKAASSARFGARHRDQLFPGQAARLLRRRRRGDHRRRRARRYAAQPAHARAGQRPDTTTCASGSPRASTPSRPRCCIEKLKIFPDEIAARDRVARRYYAKRSRDVVTVPTVPAGADLGLGAVHHPRARRAARRARRRAQGRGHPDRDLLPDPAAPPAGLQALSDRRPAASPSASAWPDEVISLPMHAYLDEADAGRASSRAVRRILRT